VRILIVDDQEAVRRAIGSVLASRADWSVCGEAADGLQAVEMARQLRPDVILMDMSMPKMDGAEATRIIGKEIPEAQVIIVTQNDPVLVRQYAAGMGARGYVSKATLARDLVPAIVEIIGGPAEPASFAQGQPTGNEWLSGEGEMHARMRSADWSKTALGAPQSWSPALRMMVKFLLANRFPQLLWWGPEFSSLYNDAYIPILGAKHPWALGQPVSKVWHEIWNVLKPLIETPYNGGPATWMEDIPLEINRRGFVEETHFTIAYSPVPDETMPNGIGGVLATVHEISEKVIAERRVQVLRDLGARSVEPKSPAEACTVAVDTLARHSKDIPFVFLYLFDTNRVSAHLASGTRTDAPSCPQVIPLAAAADKEFWPISKLLETEEIQLVHDVQNRFGHIAQGPWSDPPSTAALVPIRSNMSHQLAGFLIVGASSRLQFDESYRDFLELLSTQIATTLANARAYDEERKRSEALAEIDRAKTLFFSNVSHEFRTPLTLMLAPLEDILVDSQELAPEYRERLQMAHRNSLRLLKLVNTLLDFSRIEAGRIEAVYQPTELSTLTAELAGMFRSATERAGLRLVIQCSPLAQPVYVDQEMWEKIVFNLLSNAFKFTFEGEIEVSVRATEGAMQFSVRDTGIGISEREIPHLFERFYRVKGARGRTLEGSGIGLSLVDELVRLHGGTVSVQSQPNVGSTFTVSIPFGKDHLPADRIEAPRMLESTALRGDAYVQEALRWLPGSEFVSDELPPAVSAVPTDTLSLAPSARPSCRVLVADDNADMREYMRRLLAGQYELEFAADGESALKLAREHHPDLILADVMMPRLDGFALLQAVRADETLKSIPVILLSARAGEEARIEGFQSGADDYLIKPFSARELQARVRAHLAMTRFRREAAELERRLRLDAELLAAIVASSDDGIVSKNLDGTITSWNRGAERIFGYTAQEAVGRHITLIIPPERRDEETNILSRLRRGERIDHFHTVRVRKDGAPIDVSLSISPIRDSSGHVVGASKVARDISAQIRADRALRESEENYRRLAETLEREVRARTLELETRNAEILRQADLLRDFSQRFIQAQDEERRRIARELHDSAGQTLTVLGISLAQLVQKAARRDPQLANDAEMIQETVQQLHREIRTASYLLHPPLLDENGLASALQWYVQGLVERSGLDIQLDISEDFGRLPRDLELVVFRVVQESLTNIHRHSGSKTAKIRIAREADAVSLEVQDEGGGMPPEKLAQIHSSGSGVGIRGMRERIRQFEGLMNIESNSSGTRISVAIPIPASAASAEAAAVKPLRAAR
jgi:PAS domain S-box-containing protein